MKQVEEEKEKEKEKKKNNFKNLILYVLLVIISLVGIFFLSTCIRWNATIEDKYEVIYYGQEDIKLKEVTEFYGGKIDTKLAKNEALKLYCDSEHGGTCVTADYSNKLENILRHPIVVVSIVIMLDLVIIYLLIKDKEIGNIKIYILSGLVLLYGLYLFINTMVVTLNYYGFVHNSKYVTNGIIYKGIRTSNPNEFKGLVKYQVKDKEYITYLDNLIDGSIDSKVNSKITLYYDKKDPEVIISKKSMIGMFIPFIVSLLIILESYFIFKLKRRSKYELVKDEK